MQCAISVKVFTGPLKPWHSNQTFYAWCMMKSKALTIDYKLRLSFLVRKKNHRIWNRSPKFPSCKHMCSSVFRWILPHKHPKHAHRLSHAHTPQHIHTQSLRMRWIIKVNGDSPDLRAQKIGWNHLDFIIPFTLPPDHKVVLRACFMYSAAFPPSTSMWSRLNKPSSGAQLQQQPIDRRQVSRLSAAPPARWLQQVGWE